MKKRLMASLLTLCMLLTLLPATALAAGMGAFTDVAEDAWYYDEVQFVKDEGLMNGVGGSQFGPELTVTRAMMVTMLWRMAGSPKAEGTQFTDVAAGQYYADAALWACANGIANGCGDSTFKPDNAITREQMAAFMYRYADYKGYDMDADGDLSKFSDADAVSEYAKAAMAWANAEGLITGMGDGALAPQNSATRAQIASLLYRFCTLLEGGSDLDGEYTVTFEWNYSDEGTYKTVTVKAGETVDKPTNPRRSGYSFDGWYTKAEGGEKFDFDTEIDEDVTLYARWTKSSGGSSSHTHDWSNWVSNGDGTHTRTCSKNSSHKETEDCALSGYEPCPDCGWTDGKYHISTAEELTAFAAAVNGGESFRGKTVVLDADVTLTGAWTPIGTAANTFSGTFNGRGKTISGLTAEGTEYVGLFGVVYGTVENVALDGADISGSHWVGGIAGYLKSGEIRGCSVTNSAITATPDGTDPNFDNGDKVGGIVGYAYNGTDGHAAITDCTVSGLTLAAYRDVGGIAGAGNGEDVTGCTAADVTITVDQKSKPYGTKAPNADGILGRNLNGTAVTGNTQSNITIDITLNEENVVAMVGDNTYTTLAEAVANANAGDTVTLVDDIESDQSFTVNGFTLNGNGHTIAFTTPGDVYGINLKAGTVKNLTTFGSFRSVGESSAITGDVIIENCVLGGANTAYPLHIGGGNYDIVVKDSTLYGWTSYGSTVKSATFENCTFAKGESDYEYLRAYVNTTLTDCAFVGNFQIGTANKAATIIVNNPTLDEGTSAYYLFAWDDADNATIIVNGLKLLADGLAMDEDGNYVITNANGLKFFAEQVNGGTTYAGETIKLAVDVDLNNEAWTPIGSKANQFKGTFDGQEKTISNLNVDMADTSDVGLFGYTTNGAVKNLTINNASVKGYLDVGVVAGTPYTSTYDNITLTGDIKVEGFAYVGGMFGKNAYANLSDLTIDASEDSYVKANSVKGDTAYRTYVGGIVGFMGEGGHGITNAVSNIDVYGSTCDVGGITGIAHYGNSFTNCSSSGDVTITSYIDEGDQLEMGGIAGVWHNQTGETVTFTGCEYTGTLSAVQGDGTEYTGPFMYDGLVGSAYDPTETGKLVIDGVLITNETISGADGLAAALESVSSMNGEVTLPVEDAELGWVTGAAHGSTPFLGEDATVETVVIDGGENGAVLTATGAGVGPIRAANGGTLVFKNITFVDQSKSYAENAWEFAYLEMGGKLVFENCVFSDPIQLETGAEATFTDCSFEGKTVDGLTMYAVWVGGGSATFTGCTFEGTRGIKIHEAYGSDVTEVIIDGCTFDSLSEKPGVAIGTVDATTVITITDSEFINCQAGDQDMYIYETDTDVTTFGFTCEGNTVE